MPLREIPEASEDPESSTGVETGDDLDDDDWWVFDSSRVTEAAYDRESDQLFIRFVKPVPGQVEYVYRGVTSEEWRRFRRSASPGKFINRVLNQHEYERTR